MLRVAAPAALHELSPGPVSTNSVAALLHQPPVSMLSTTEAQTGRQDLDGSLVLSTDLDVHVLELRAVSNTRTSFAT